MAPFLMWNSGALSTCQKEIIFITVWIYAEILFACLLLRCCLFSALQAARFCCLSEGKKPSLRSEWLE